MRWMAAFGLAVAAAGEPVAVDGAGGCRDRCGAGVGGVAVAGGEAGDVGGLGQQLGGGEVRAAGQVQQLRAQRLDPGVQVALQGADPLGDGLDVGGLLGGEQGLHGGGLPVQERADPGEVGRSVQGAGGDVEVRVEVVQVPAQPVDQAGALGDEVVTVVDQQLGARGRRGRGWPRAGRGRPARREPPRGRRWGRTCRGCGWRAGGPR
jgi:hypothetical protein